MTPLKNYSKRRPRRESERRGTAGDGGWSLFAVESCDTLGIKRRGVHDFRATAACEFVDIKRALGYSDAEARRELATLAPHATALRCSAGVWLGHNPHRTEVTYAYVPRNVNPDG
jgi:hypothetical protein